MDQKISWMILIYKVPPEPSTLRVKTWRKVKELGALYLQQSVVVFPKMGSLEQEFINIVDDIRGSEGEAFLFELAPLSENDEETMVIKINEQRDQEYHELMEKCKDFLDELKKETEKGNFTFAELEENDEEINKLSKWFFKIRERDIFNSIEREKAEEMMAVCRQKFSEFAQTVYKREGTI